MNDTQKPARSTTGRASKGFTDEERAAMKERAQELKAAARRGPRAGKADGESAVLAKIAEMPEPDRAMAERLHAIIKASAPALSPRTWYGMPAYAKDGNVVCFFQSAQKFKTRYATLGFSDKANLDEGDHVADRLRAEGVDRRRRGKDRRAGEESGELGGRGQARRRDSPALGQPRQPWRTIKEQGICRQSVLMLKCSKSAHGAFSGCLRARARSFHHEA